MAKSFILVSAQLSVTAMERQTRRTFPPTNGVGLPSVLCSLDPSLGAGARSLSRTTSFTAMELERVKATPFHRLQRKELKARKLLGRFNDDRQDLGIQAVRTRASIDMYALVPLTVLRPKVSCTSGQHDLRR